ncbi:MAG TPA: alpha/beta hydrolase fold domain-containing protein [Luteolibacter sp.]|nr:alpha/beta hydrolase fold domain-containing protein [Luteolibacter sp.]
MTRAAAFACCLLMSWSLAQAVVPKNDFKPDKDIVYKQPEGKELALHVFLPEGWKPQDKRPAAVFFFGGGWVGGSARQFYPQCMALRARGMVAISADYRTQGSHRTGPESCVEDGKSAVRWIRTHAAELGIDPNRLAVGGGSAGGHVAAASTFCKGFDAAGENASISTRANALLLFNPVLDNGPDGGWGHAKVKDFWQKISPAHNVNAPVPPVLFMLGTKDNLIPVSTAERFKKTVETAGGRCELKLYENATHGFFNSAPHSDQTTADMIAFLTAIGWIQP